MQINERVKAVLGEEWVQLILPGFEERIARGARCWVDSTHVRVDLGAKRKYNNKTDDREGGVGTTP